MTISLFKLFQQYGLDDLEKVKMYRHTDHVVRGFNADMEVIYSRGEIEQFQSFQGQHILGDGFLCSFIGENNGLSRFVGIWRITEHGSGDAIAHTTSNLDYFAYVIDSDHWYKMDRDIRFDDLIDRLVIKWPVGRVAHRWLVQDNGIVTDFDIHSIRAIGLNRTFPGFDKLQLSFEELCTLNKQGDGGNGWIEALRSTRGVYLISDQKTGKLYIGSATGSDGIWGRWQDYVNSIHGGNLVVKQEVENCNLNSSDLSFSILQTLGNLDSNKNGLHAEQRWKNKFGKAAITLNGN